MAEGHSGKVKGTKVIMDREVGWPRKAAVNYTGGGTLKTWTT